MNTTSIIQEIQVRTKPQMGVKVFSFKPAVSKTIKLIEQYPQIEIVSQNQAPVTAVRHIKCDRCGLMFNYKQIHVSISYNVISISL
jgi:hypothetical protein